MATFFVLVGKFQAGAAVSSAARIPKINRYKST
uniref:Uncharacterized protein n=1 Tax=Myoviridae sp. ctCop38 TaxID=2826632 RepID=A0A8S5MYV2_9CAUD|nr:MAG TPA: hypothetical protein [Myoviridae sp. ctCop38]DAK02750.1 MAG TPA: hypothetical protein [Caudoviricetes sp.]